LSLKEGWIVAVMGVVQLGIPYWLFSKGLEQISVQEASLIVLIERYESHLGSADRGGIAVGRDVSRWTLYRRQLGFSLSPLVFESSKRLDPRAVL